EIDWRGSSPTVREGFSVSNETRPPLRSGYRPGSLRVNDQEGNNHDSLQNGSDSFADTFAQLDDARPAISRAHQEPTGCDSPRRNLAESRQRRRPRRAVEVRG